MFQKFRLIIRNCFKSASVRYPFVTDAQNDVTALSRKLVGPCAHRTKWRVGYALSDDALTYGWNRCLKLPMTILQVDLILYPSP